MARMARKLYSGRIAAATKAARVASQPGSLVAASQARSTSTCALLREPAVPYEVGCWRKYELRWHCDLFVTYAAAFARGATYVPGECGGVGHEEVAVPAQLGAKSTQRTQQLDIEPHARNMKAKETLLHESDEVAA